MERPIVLINVSKPEDVRIPPLALLYVGGALKKEGYDVKVYSFSTRDIQKYAKEVAEIKPLYLGVSVFTGSKTRDSADFSKAVKAIDPTTPILWGGIHPSLLPYQCLNEDYIDYVVVGEGEETIVEFTKAMLGRVNFEDIFGLGYKKNGIIKLNQKRPFVQDLDKYSLDWSLIDVEKFLDRHWDSKKILGFISSRGCPFDCSFCYNQEFNARKWRAHGTKKVINEIKELKDRYNIDGLRFYDDLLFANPPRAIEIVREVKLPWYGEIRIGMINEKITDVLIETECREVLFGLESGSDRILRLMDKAQTVEAIRKGVKLLNRAKELRTVGSFIVGVPTETKEETFETVNLILELLKINPNMRYSVGFYLPYPGSAMYNLAIKEGFKPFEKTEDWDALDRWADRLKLTWLNWMQDSSYFKAIRDYVNLLPLNEVKVPFIRSIPEKRLKNKDFSHKYELSALSYLQHQFAVDGTFVNKVGRAVLPYIRG
ncbi:B12-binding domain-containing radical SAM protein [Candidatus Woesearchaeota archaeon]|nr:B12-binding domain-containing radical SAM protein [Candidatus Woesearchaeota archaeon]